ncbi:MAG: VOC family protein [Hyphomicrobiaceae bacterium]|nr:VOC family protein [Hyphomicrobiaceae bacterium]
MPIGRLEHVNVRTANLDAMIAWYGRVLGMQPGWRPPFKFPGAWLYCGDQPAVHLVGVPRQPEPGEALRLEHFAFSATGLVEMVQRLEAEKVPYAPIRVPGSNELQINVHDPDGNHIHIDFSAAEADAADIKAGEFGAMSPT